MEVRWNDEEIIKTAWHDFELCCSTDLHRHVSGCWFCRGYTDCYDEIGMVRDADELEEVNPLDKDILVQYCEMKEEIKDLRQRIMKLDKFLQDPPIVADTVTGSRKDLTIGPIKVTGIPDPIYRRKQVARERYKKLLELKEAELLELTTQAEEYIDSIPKSELRIMFRLYFIDGLSDAKVADRMNRIFPNRNKKYTDENVKKRRQRFFEKIENVPPCPDER